MVIHITLDELPDISHRNAHWEIVPNPGYGGTWARAIVPGDSFPWTPEDCPSCNGHGCEGLYLIGQCNWCADGICHGCGWYVS